jgi:hypothetical protein
VVDTSLQVRIQARGVDDSGRVLRMTCAMWLLYDPALPFEVRLADSAGSELVFGRELLADALRDGRGGDGAVQLHLTYQGHSHLLILTRPDACPFAFKTDSVATFLERTFAAVPAGSETIDVDAELSTLFGQAA